MSDCKHAALSRVEELYGRRCGDCLENVGNIIRDSAAERDALRAENARLKEALEEAPEPAHRSTGARGPYYEHPGREPADEDYACWFDTTRAEALGHE